MGAIDNTAITAQVRVLARLSPDLEVLTTGERMGLDPGLLLCHAPELPLPWLVVDQPTGRPITPGARVRGLAVMEAEAVLSRRAKQYGISVRELLDFWRAERTYGEGRA